MKNNKKRLFRMVLLCCLSTGLWSACKKDGRGSAPLITRVRTVAKDTVINNVVQRLTLDSSIRLTLNTNTPLDSTVTSGGLNGLFAIMGEHLSATLSVSFNGQPVYFNPALVTDKSIIVTIPLTATWGSGASNELTVVTRYGTATFPFTILQPAPVITSFSPLYAGAGEIITITGTTFNDVSSVKIGDTPAEIVGKTGNTQIQVRVPAGNV